MNGGKGGLFELRFTKEWLLSKESEFVNCLLGESKESFEFDRMGVIKESDNVILELDGWGEDIEPWSGNCFSFPEKMEELREKFEVEAAAAAANVELEPGLRPNVEAEKEWIGRDVKLDLDSFKEVDVEEWLWKEILGQETGDEMLRLLSIGEYCDLKFLTFKEYTERSLVNGRVQPELDIFEEVDDDWELLFVDVPFVFVVLVRFVGFVFLEFIFGGVVIFVLDREEEDEEEVVIEVGRDAVGFARALDWIVQSREIGEVEEGEGDGSDGGKGRFVSDGRGGPPSCWLEI